MYEPLEANKITKCPVCNSVNISCCTDYKSHIFQSNSINGAFSLQLGKIILLFHPEFGYRIDFYPQEESIDEIKIPPFELKNYKTIVEKYKKMKCFI